MEPGAWNPEPIKVQKKISIILLIIVAAAFLIFANSKGALSGVFDFAGTATSPISLFFANLSEKTSGFFSGVFSLGKLQSENASLKDNVNRLQAEIAQLTEAKKENERLKKDLGFAQAHQFTYEAAEVTAFDPSNIRGMITVNKGTNSGIRQGMAVISEGFMIGRVSETLPNASKIQLITDPTSAIPVTIQDSTTNGIAKGEIGAGLTMEKIPQGERINEGDTVITSGLGGEIPRGLILGKVENIKKQENSLFATASIRPSAELALLYRLIIIKG